MSMEPLKNSQCRCNAHEPMPACHRCTVSSHMQHANASAYANAHVACLTCRAVPRCRRARVLCTIDGAPCQGRQLPSPCGSGRCSDGSPAVARQQSSEHGREIHNRLKGSISDDHSILDVRSSTERMELDSTMDPYASGPQVHEVCLELDHQSQEADGGNTAGGSSSATTSISMGDATSSNGSDSSDTSSGGCITLRDVCATDMSSDENVRASRVWCVSVAYQAGSVPFITHTTPSNPLYCAMCMHCNGWVLFYKN